MPAEVFGPDYAFLPRKELLTFEEIERLVKLFVSLGVSKIRLTGGEPLLRKDIDQLIAGLASITGVADLALTTNALLLPRYAARLKQAGLHRINVSLDAISPEIFRAMTGNRDSVNKVFEGIDAACHEKLDTKVNMVVERGVNEGEILPMAKAFKERGITLRFIEFMDVGNVNGWAADKVVPSREILNRLGQHWKLEPVKPAYNGEVAKRYRYLDDSVEIGLISSVSQPFCSACSRARLSADGHLFTCLFSGNGHTIRPLLRGEAPLSEPMEDQGIREWIAAIWNRRDDRYSELRRQMRREMDPLHKVEMSYIGG